MTIKLVSASKTSIILAVISKTAITLCPSSKSKSCFAMNEMLIVDVPAGCYHGSHNDSELTQLFPSWKVELTTSFIVVTHFLQLQTK